MSDPAQFESSVTEPSGTSGAIMGQFARPLRSVQLVGFSVRDREIMRLFLRRPPGTGIRLEMVESDADLLIGNTASPDVLGMLHARGASAPAVGIVERFERGAPFYQIAQDGQLLFSLAQAINRIRSGWTPPLSSPTVGETLAGTLQDRAAENATAEPVAAVASQQISEVVAASGFALAPAPVASAAAVIATSDGLPWQRALNILVVDDSHFSREAISAALVKVGFSVETASSGAAGLRKAAEKHFDVALVDFEMPEMLGTEVLRKLRGLGNRAPSVLIMLTSRTGAVDRLRAKFAGCDAYLTKPTQMKEFLATLRNLALAGKLSRQ